MVDRRRCFGKRTKPRFSVPPWNKEHPGWQELEEELPQNHIARKVLAALGHLDLSPLFGAYSASGSPATRPDLMLAVVLIEMRRGRYRPHQWHEDMKENDALKWAGMGICPSRTAWYDFHDRVGPLLEGFHKQLIEASLARRVTDGTQASLDGSTFAANASRHRLINQSRLTQRLEKLNAACAVDAADEPVDDVPAWMGKTPETRENQRIRYQRAQRRLVELHEINRRQNPCRRRNSDKIVVSTSDPDAALGRDKFHVFRPLYNVQFVLDLNSPLILAYEVFAQPTDAGTLKPMLEKLDSIQGLSLADLLVDSGYVTASQLALCEQAGITLYGPWQENDYSKTQQGRAAKQSEKIGKAEFTWVEEEQRYVCPQGHPLHWIGRQKRSQADGEIHVVHSYRCSPEHCTRCPIHQRCTTNPKRGRAVKRSEHEPLVEAHRARMATAAAKQLYKRRKETVELSFADAKENRSLRRFPRRGLRHARTHIGLLVLAHTLLSYHRATMHNEQDKQATLSHALART